MAINTIIAKTTEAVSTPEEFTVTGPFFLHTFGFLPGEMAGVVRLDWPESGDDEIIRGESTSFPNLKYYRLPAGTYGMVKGKTANAAAMGWEAE